MKNKHNLHEIPSGIRSEDHKYYNRQTSRTRSVVTLLIGM